MKPTRYKREYAVAQTVADMQRKFVYPDADTQPGPPFISGGGGAPTIVIAASDSSDFSKNKADFICPGVNDHDTIMAGYNAMSQVYGGRILLCEGTFFCAYGELAFTSANRAVTLQGMGTNSTFLQFSGTTGNGITAQTGGDHILDMVILDDGGASGAGIRLHAGEGCRVQRVLFGNSGTGLLLDSSTSASREAVISDCFFNSVGGIGIDATVVSPQTGRGLIIANNQFVEVANHCIRLSRWSSALVTGNSIFHVTGSSTISGIVVNTPMEGLVIADNRLIDRGIAFNGGSRCIVEDNHVTVSSGHALSMTDVSRCLIQGNMLDGVGALGASDRIHLAGNSDNNYIVDNHAVGNATGTKPRFGINISAATCDNNAVYANYLGATADFGTGDFNDAGTGTLIAPAANGQFVY